jgi:hypothetical protein
MAIPRHPKLERLHEYWLSKRGDRRFPSRADLDPLDMAFIVGNICLVDVIARDPLGFRTRLMRTNVVQALGVRESGRIIDRTGKTFDEVPPTEFRALARRSFETVASSGDVMHACRDQILDGKHYQYETLILPLSTDGIDVDMLLVGFVFGKDPHPTSPGSRRTRAQT